MHPTTILRTAVAAFLVALPLAAMAQSPAFQAPPTNLLQFQTSEPSPAPESPAIPEAAEDSLSRQLADWIDPPKTDLPTASISEPPADAAPEKESLEYEPSAFPEPINLGSLVLRLFGGTAIVLAGCVAFLWFGKHWLKQGTLFSGESNRMRVIETLGLSPGCCVKLIDIDGKRFAAAIDSTGMKDLVPLGDTFDESLARLEAEAAEEPATNEEPQGDPPVSAGEPASIPFNTRNTSPLNQEPGNAFGNRS